MLSPGSRRRSAAGPQEPTAVAASPEAPSEKGEQVRAVMYQSIIVLIVVTSVLVVFGVIMVYSATAPESIRDSMYNSNVSRFSTANKQLLLAVMGSVIAAAMAFVPMQVYQRLAKILFGLGVLLQLAVFTPLGVNVGGNTNWVGIGGFTLQPSEFLKLATVVILGVELSKVKPGESDWRKFKIAGGCALFGLILIMAGKDMGTGMMYALLCVGMFWLAGLPGKVFAYLGGLGVLAASILVAASRSRLERVISYFQNLFTLPNTSTPSQSDFALWAFGSGGIGGSGLGTGAEKWPGNLAEAQTDFIFAVVGEELGLLGCLVVIALFMVLGWALLRISRYHPSRFARLVSGGVAVWLCGQALANMLVVTGVLPVFGVPLPFISQGGSSVMACVMAVGLVISCARAVPGVKESFRVRGRLASRARVLLRKG
ncbi:FtsW/RodA/SpoVE family cell cycle protein [Changpingibacter yushuensis]|uniref:FtsW/RodA/SpoVE family cell cycle protein n=1 Tax=Changpingibacter yushuensis TaxID=2758440 RepID=UPI002934AA97|nr:putative peptidoglycan glycosyltransferase FtsW [Changpingibacter yushuensis]